MVRNAGLKTSQTGRVAPPLVATHLHTRFRSSAYIHCSKIGCNTGMTHTKYHSMQASAFLPHVTIATCARATALYLAHLCPFAVYFRISEEHSTLVTYMI